MACERVCLGSWVKVCVGDGRVERRESLVVDSINNFIYFLSFNMNLVCGRMVGLSQTLPPLFCDVILERDMLARDCF